MSPNKPEPSALLKEFLLHAEMDESSVICREQLILDAIFPENANGGEYIFEPENDISSEELNRCALKLYYEVLERSCNLCAADNVRLESLLNDRFLVSMIFNSALSVLDPYEMVLDIHVIMKSIGISGYDLILTSSLFKHEETSSTESMNWCAWSVEMQILESVAWERGSSMYNFLILARPELAAEMNDMGLLAEPMPSVAEIVRTLNSLSQDKVALIKRKPRKRQLPTCITSQIKYHLQSVYRRREEPKLTSGSMDDYYWISVFLGKVLHLASYRIEEFCVCFELPNNVMENIYWVFEQILYDNTALFFNRHIDQIIACSMFYVAELHGTPVSLHKLVYYKNLLQYDIEVLRKVLIDFSKEEYGSVAAFRRKVYARRLRSLMAELARKVSYSRLNNIEDKLGERITLTSQAVDISKKPGPSPLRLLEHYFSCANVDESSVMKRACIILDALVRGMNCGHAELVKSRALDLFYKALEITCLKEAGPEDDLGMLLNEKFHRAMVVFSAVLALDPYDIAIDFPSAKKVIGISDFDMILVSDKYLYLSIENVISSELRSRMDALEHHILWRSAWEKGSAMYNSLIVAMPQLANDIHSMGLLAAAEPMPSLDALADYANTPILEGKLLITCKSTIPGLTPTDAIGGPPVWPHKSPFPSIKKPILKFKSAEQSFANITFFLWKVVRRAYFRIGLYCRSLKLPRRMMRQASLLFRRTVYEEATLHFNRHVDQIIICCISAVAQWNKMKLTIQDVIIHYPKLQLSDLQVPVNMFPKSPDEEELIELVTFYHTIFSPWARPLFAETEPEKNKIAGNCDVEKNKRRKKKTTDNCDDVEKKKRRKRKGNTDKCDHVEKKKRQKRKRNTNKCDHVENKSQKEKEQLQVTQ